MNSKFARCAESRPRFPAAFGSDPAIGHPTGLDVTAGICSYATGQTESHKNRLGIGTIQGFV